MLIKNLFGDENVHATRMAVVKSLPKPLSNSTKTTIRAMIDFFFWCVVQKFANITKVPRHLEGRVVLFRGAIFVDAILGKFLGSLTVHAPHVSDRISFKEKERAKKQREFEGKEKGNEKERRRPRENSHRSILCSSPSS